MNRKLWREPLTAKRLLSVFLVLGLGGIVIKFGVEQLIAHYANPVEIRQEIEKELTEATGLQASVQQLAITPTLLQGIQVTLSDIVFTPTVRQAESKYPTTNKAHSALKPLIQVEKGYLSLRYWPILTGQKPSIASIDLHRGRLLGGAPQALGIPSIWNYPYPFLKPDFFKNKPDAPIVLNDTRIQLKQFVLLSTQSNQVIQLPELTLHHVMSHQALQIKGVLQFASRQLELFAETSPMGEDAKKLSHKKWQLQDLTKLDLNLKVLSRASSVNSNYDLVVSWLPSGHLKLQSDKLDRAFLTESLSIWEEQFNRKLSPILSEFPKQGWLKSSLDVELNLDAVYKLKQQPKQQKELIKSLQGSLSLHQLSLPQQWQSALQIEPHFLNGELLFSGQKVELKQVELKNKSDSLMLTGHYNWHNQDVMLKALGKNIQLEHHWPVLKAVLQRQNLLGKSLSPEFEKAFNTSQMKGLLSFDLGVRGKLLPEKIEILGDLLGQHLEVVLPNSQSHFSIPNLEVVAQKQHWLIQPTEIYVHQGGANKAKALISTLNLSGQLSAMGQPEQIKLNADRTELKTLASLIQVFATQFFTAQAQSQKQKGNLALLNNFQLNQIEGVVSGDLLYQKPLQQQATLSSHLTFSPVLLRDAKRNTLLSLKAFKLNLDQNRFTSDPIQGQLVGVPFRIEGQAVLSDGATNPLGSGLASYQVRFQTEMVSLSQLKQHQAEWLKLADLSGLNTATLPKIWNTAGAVKLEGDWSSRLHQVKLTFADAGFSWEGGDFPLYQLNGTLKATQAASTPVSNASWQLSPSALRFRYANSPLQLSVSQSPNLLISINGEASPLLLNHWLTAPQSVQGEYASLPFKMAIDQHPKTKLMNGLFYLDLAYEHAERPVFLNMPFQLSADFQNLTIKPSNLHMANQGELWLEGGIQKLLDPLQLAWQCHLVTAPQINLKGMEEHFAQDWFKGADGQITAELTLSGKPEEKPIANGFIALESILLPKLDIENLSTEMKFEDQKALIDVQSFNIPGVQLSAKAESTEVTTFPIPLENVSIQGTLFDVLSFQDFSRKVIDGVIVQQLVQRLIRPWQEGDPVVPVTFNKANINIAETVYKNILLDDLSGKLSLYSNGYFELSEVALKVADGQLRGYLSMSPLDNNFTSLELQADRVKANALMRALLNVSNQVIGDLNGSIRFTTSGKTDVEMLENANGTVRMMLTDGRLPSVASIETLLTAANVIRGGLLGLNLNNVLRAVAPYKSTYFAELSGDLLIANKQLHTNNILSNGKNLDMLIQGTMDLDDGDADLTINGKMKQDVSGQLGALGKFSIGRLLKWIPLLGFIPGTEKNGILFNIPGIGYLPGVGGPARDVNRFQVKLDGPVQDPASMKAFEWVNP